MKWINWFLFIIFCFYFFTFFQTQWKDNAFTSLLATYIIIPHLKKTVKIISPSIGCLATSVIVCLVALEWFGKRKIEKNCNREIRRSVLTPIFEIFTPDFSVFLLFFVFLIFKAHPFLVLRQPTVRLGLRTWKWCKHVVITFACYLA